MTKNKYLLEREERLYYKKIKKYVTFGYLIGIIFIILALINGLFVIKANGLLWKSVFAIGCLFFIAALVFPQALYYPEKIWTILSKIIGRFVFSTILSLTYFLIFTPISIFFRKTKNSSYFVSWNDNNEKNFNLKWEPKRINVISDISKNKSKRNLIIQFFNVIRFFIDNKQWWLIPLIIVLLLIGLILFFVQSSVLAPFIYTLF